MFDHCHFENIENMDKIHLNSTYRSMVLPLVSARYEVGRKKIGVFHPPPLLTKSPDPRTRPRHQTHFFVGKCICNSWNEFYVWSHVQNKFISFITMAFFFCGVWAKHHRKKFEVVFGSNTTEKFPKGVHCTDTKRGTWSKTTVVKLITNILLRRGGIWNLAFKHHGKISKLTEKFENSLGCASWVFKFFSEFWNFSVVFEPNSKSHLSAEGCLY